MKRWMVNTELARLTVGKVYEAYSENNFNVAIKNDDGVIEYVQKKYLVEVKHED